LEGSQYIVDSWKMSSLQLGNYKIEGWWFKILEVKNENTAVPKPSVVGDIEITINYGDYGNLVVSDTIGEKVMNVELVINLMVETHTIHGVMLDEGAKLVLKTSSGLVSCEKISTEEAKDILDDGDPVDAPATPYKIQPENQGKLLWFTGPPGLGKSTTAMLFARDQGYVYYEGDCFGQLKNPYVPLNAEDPSMASIQQKDLKGEGLERRKEVMKNVMMAMKPFLEGEYKKEVFDDFYSLLCEDIKKEKARIGGNWAVAQCVILRDMRDFIRSKMGSDMVFVSLEMEMESNLERLRKRHKGEEAEVESLKKYIEKCEPAGDDEEGIITVTVTRDMQPNDVLMKTLQMIK